MPLQQRIPKFGFSSRVNRGSKEINLKNISTMTEVNLDTLKANRIISKATKKVKIFGICELSQPMTITGINVTKGAKKSIEKLAEQLFLLNLSQRKKNLLKLPKKQIKKFSNNRGFS